MSYNNIALLGKALIGLSVGAGLLLISLLERTRLVTDQHTIVLDRSTGPGFRLRILHISDLHMSGRSLFRRWRLRRYIQQIRRLQYDVVVHTGDMLDDADGIDQAVSFLREIADGRPVFAVPGNHDYHSYSWLENILNVHTLRKWGWVGDIPLNDWLGRLGETAGQEGIVFLTNEGRRVHLNGADIWLAGVDDLMLGAPDMNRALATAPRDIPIILLSHNPDLFPWAAMAGVDIVLAGHTHGGQVRLPCIGAVITRTHVGRDMATGLVRLGKAFLHVTRGLGETLPLRLNCTPQATIIELLGSKSAASSQETHLSVSPDRPPPRDVQSVPTCTCPIPEPASLRAEGSSVRDRLPLPLGCVTMTNALTMRNDTWNCNRRRQGNPTSYPIDI